MTNVRRAVPYLACLLPFLGHAQAVLQGSISDAGSGRPLIGVAVFMPELHIGTVTDTAGAYVLNVPHGGRYTVQFTMIGRESVFQDIAVQDEPIQVDVQMRTSPMQLQEVTIIGDQVDAPKATSRAVSVVSTNAMRDRGALNVSDGVSRLPGVSQLTTGVGISKPVIRGLYGNRVQVNMLGQRFDNQQWQDEHGLGLSDVGIDRVEVIKGPAALQYGSEAIGGVLNVIEDRPAPVGTTEQDLHLGAMSNTGGGTIAYAIKGSKQRLWYRVAAGADSHGDYASSGNARVLNSRSAMYTGKASLGWRKGRWSSTEHLLFSFGQFGFVFDTASRAVDDGRYARSFEGPHHQVTIGMFGTENTYHGERLKWTINGGWTTNKRQEQEGGNKISLDMLLNTASLRLQAVANVGAHATWTNGIALMYRTNTNLGSRTIVPDARTLEGGLFSLYRLKRDHVAFEGGVRLDDRAIRTLATSDLNPVGSPVEPFDRSWTGLNGSLGVAWDPCESFNLKVNVSSGYRSGNLAELSSNGLHEGTARFEIGDPDLGLEQNVCAELGGAWDLDGQLELSASVYRNQFFDYIYLAPTGEEYLGLMIYRFLRSDAVLQGGECALDLHPKALRRFVLHADYSLLRAEKASGDPLPFIPADRVQGELTFTPSDRWWASFGVRHVLQQDRPAEFETATPAYTLLDARLGWRSNWPGSTLRITLYGTNLADVRYVDHLSRFKTFGLYDMGRNVGLSLQLTL
ncbi:MAG: TonB-dependent receptor [Flavobacteriales bacterium]|nr:TonB-dependent receptor [Flavobacteriales bacterium]